MMSSRWPRPTGTSESTALRPDSIGSCTDWRAMMPGAFTSIRWRVTSVITPLPSIGSPRPSTTRPSMPSPTGMSMIAPVRLTVSPSLIARSLPNTTTPTLSFSRLRAMPRRPESNSTISPACTCCRPCTLTSEGRTRTGAEAQRVGERWKAGAWQASPAKRSTSRSKGAPPAARAIYCQAKNSRALAQKGGASGAEAEPRGARGGR
mmetsp:Transcript_52750/g.136587  ORF Transcript_52750/g.136587 Transcript_52750/m.136587 type:complete len:206 (-) Transcript_52750:380-997(-)